MKTPNAAPATYASARRAQWGLAALVLVLLVLLVPQAGAQNIKKGRKNIYFGRVVNHLTGEDISKGRVYLLRTDSAVVDSMSLSDDMNVNNYRCPYVFNMPAEGGDFILKAVCEGYDTLFLPVTMRRSKSRNWLTEGPELRLRRPARHQTDDNGEALGEATVVATKLKFYHKGDTLVYNADAFNLAEGSMLDALIRQMPGAELRDNGEIYVNGKKVESLLLNGDDFFKGNNQIMLDNLPAYMVQNVQVYDKASERGRLLGQRLGDETYVMDVKLKKTYEIGWIGNAEAGYGTHDRYLARLFAMRFTSQSRLTFYANQNNLNDTRKPGESTTWSPDDMPAGRKTALTAGFDYNIKQRRGRYVLNGNAEVSHSDLNVLTRTASETFLSGGNTFGRAEQQQRSHNVGFKTNHELRFTRDAFTSFTIEPSFSYSKWENRFAGASAAFLSDPSAYASTALLDSIRRPFGPGSKLAAITQYRQTQESLDAGHRLAAAVGSESMWRVPGLTDIVGFAANVNYYDARSRSFGLRSTDYPADAAQNDFRRTFTDTRPDRKGGYALKPAYILTFPRNVVLNFEYTLDQAFLRQEANTYRLDRLAEWGADGGQAVGALPSDEAQLLGTLDAWNSYVLHQTTTTNTLSLGVHWNTVDNGPTHWQVHAGLPVTFERKHATRYRRADFDGSRTYRMTAVTPALNIMHGWQHFKWMWQFYAATKATSPDMTSLFDIENTLDPVNVYRGNPGLKNSYLGEFIFNLNLNDTEKQRKFSVSSRYQITQNAVVWAYNYDRTTGRRNYRADNVNGNYNIKSSINFETPLDKKKRLTFRLRPYLAYNHGVDLISSDETAPRRSGVGVLDLMTCMDVKYKFGERADLGLTAAIDWYRTNSSRPDFESLSPYTFDYGLTGRVSLPWDVELSTDLRMYSRRGYNDRSANTDDLVWTARLSKAIPKLSLTFMVDGFDLLHQLSNRSVTLNSQGRVETWKNTLPSYFLFHIVYKLNVKPKRR